MFNNQPLPSTTSFNHFLQPLPSTTSFNHFLQPLPSTTSLLALQTPTLAFPSTAELSFALSVLHSTPQNTAIQTTSKDYICDTHNTPEPCVFIQPLCSHNHHREITLVCLDCSLRLLTNASHLLLSFSQKIHLAHHDNYNMQPPIQIRTRPH
jgi:hypothetical protein